MKQLFMKYFRCPGCAQAELEAPPGPALFHIPLSDHFKLYKSLTKGQRGFPGCIPDFLCFRLAQVGNLLNALHSLLEERRISLSSFSAVWWTFSTKQTQTQTPISSDIQIPPGPFSSPASWVAVTFPGRISTLLPSLLF